MTVNMSIFLWNTSTSLESIFPYSPRGVVHTSTNSSNTLTTKDME